MRWLAVVALPGCGTAPSVKTFEKDQRLWITRGSLGDSELYRCADMASGNDAPKPLCVKAAYRDEATQPQQPETRSGCEKEQRAVEDYQRLFDQTKDPGSRDRLIEAQEALRRCWKQ